MELHELLVTAREVQAKQGLAKQIIIDSDQRVCLNGAFLVALSGTFDYSELVAACEGSNEIREAGAKAMGFANTWDMADWNNEPERTLEEVLDRMDAAIETTALAAA